MPALYWPVGDRPRTSDPAAFSGNWLNLGRAAHTAIAEVTHPSRRKAPDVACSHSDDGWIHTRSAQTCPTSAAGKQKGRPESGGLLIHFVKSGQVLIGAASSSPRRIFASVAKVLLGSASRSVQIFVAAALLPAA